MASLLFWRSIAISLLLGILQLFIDVIVASSILAESILNISSKLMLIAALGLTLMTSIFYIFGQNWNKFHWKIPYWILNSVFLVHLVTSIFLRSDTDLQTETCRSFVNLIWLTLIVIEFLPSKFEMSDTEELIQEEEHQLQEIH